MIKMSGLTKQYGDKTVVNQLDLTLQPGVITGFLGPNGAGKSTTMKMIVDLVKPTSGEVKIDGQTYREIGEPLKKIGTLIEPAALDDNLTAWQHLSLLAITTSIDVGRVDELIQLTGLEAAKAKKVRSYSLGMKQRLGVASALMGDPDTILFDEPFNGLDVDGIRWLRRTFRELADAGKVVIVSSHLMSEIQAIADRIVIIGQGQLLADMTIEEMNAQSLSAYVRVKSSDDSRLSEVLVEQSGIVNTSGDGIEVRQLDAKRIGEITFESGVILHELTQVQPSLEDVFSEVTDGKVEFTAEGGMRDEKYTES
ncbi:ATP-binding cassette domain-containing protein [Aerococcaceae bacterium DSM 111176]|nr:ATP-binding cassette domain-containing protein [Aerococcaceae bacterium DSM 111176]